MMLFAAIGGDHLRRVQQVLTQRDYPVTIAGLDDPLAWALGWQQLPSEPSPG